MMTVVGVLIGITIAGLAGIGVCSYLAFKFITDLIGLK